MLNESVCMFNESSERQLNSGIMSEDEIGRLPWQKKNFNNLCIST